MTEHFKECASEAVSRTPNEAISARTVQSNNDKRMNFMLKDCKVNRSSGFVTENWASKSNPKLFKLRGA
jgi:hypothetical protein